MNSTLNALFYLLRADNRSSNPQLLNVQLTTDRQIPDGFSVTLSYSCSNVTCNAQSLWFPTSSTPTALSLSSISSVNSSLFQYSMNLSASLTLANSGQCGCTSSSNRYNPSQGYFLLSVLYHGSQSNAFNVDLASNQEDYCLNAGNYTTPNQLLPASTVNNPICVCRNYIAGDRCQYGNYLIIFI